MLVCFCASHINNKHRYVYFGLMLKSYLAQTEASKLIVVLSATDPKLLAMSIDLLEHCKAKGKHGNHIEYIVFEGKQFVKYKHAVETYKSQLGPDQWVFFTDDDDLWHPQRVQCFSALPSVMEKKLANRDDHMILQVNAIAEPVQSNHPLMVPKFVQEISLTDGVDRAIQYEIVRSKSEDSLREYVTYFMKFKVMKAFFEIAPDALLEHKYADMAFVGALNRSFQHSIIRYPDPSLWMYFYRSNVDVEQVCQHGDLRSLKLFEGMQAECDALNLTKDEESCLLTTLNCLECEGIVTSLKTANLDQILTDAFKTLCVNSYHVTMNQLKNKIAPFIKQCVKTNSKFFEDCTRFKVVVK